MKLSSLFYVFVLLPTLAFADGALKSGIIESSALGVSKRFNIYLPKVMPRMTAAIR